MADKLMTVFVRGRRSSWTFQFHGNPAHLADWREDGLEVYEITNAIPAWAVDLGLARAWCFVQDLFHFRNPWRR